MKTTKILNIVMLILWTICLIMNIVSAVLGNAPSWIAVFCPLVCLIMELVEKVLRGE